MMRQLTFSLLLVVMTAVIGLGWSIDQWYDSQYAAQEDPAVKTYQQLSQEFIRLISLTNITQAQLQQWAALSHGQVQIIPYAEFPLPPDLKQSFESGEPLLLDSGSGISLHYLVAAQQNVISFQFPSNGRTGINSHLRLVLTLLFYSGLALLVFVWLYPLLKRLSLLRKIAGRFGSGDLTARIPPAKISYIADIEQEFNRMAQRIENLIYDNKLLSRGLSHDLRTPIARLRFGLDVLEEANLSPAQEKTLSHLNRDLMAMETLVETLLSYARMEQGAIAFKPIPVDLHKWLSNIMQEFYSESVVVIADPEVDARVLADIEYLNMLIHNLVQNAERHGKGKIIVSVTASEREVCLTVEDDGVGIPSAEREHVLKPFYRIASGQNTQGHGMGLAIVERIAQWHKARIVLGNSQRLGGLKVSVVFVSGNY
ncbi:MAG TPA: ATP-binding protein [Cellvibrio sp.]|nr:ATP-binding protein [Cellvibrio sp.]